MNRFARLLLTGSVAAALVAALAGCTAGGAPSASGSPRVTPTPTVQGLVLDCDSLVSAADRAALLGADATSFGATSTQASARLVDLDSAAARGPLALVAVGGAECGWAHGDDTLTVRVLPHAADSWSTLAGAYANATPGATYDGGESRGGDCRIDTALSCHTNVLVGGAWLAVDVNAATAGANTEASFHDTVQRMLPAVAAAVASAPPAASGPSLDCNAADLRQELQRAYARPAITNMGVEEIFRIEAAVMLAGGTSLCQFQPSDDGSGGYFGAASVLRDASAAYDLHRAAVLAADPTASSTNATIGGTEVPVLVWTRAADDVAVRTADALVHGTWIQFRSIDMNDDAAVDLVKWIAAKV